MSGQAGLLDIIKNLIPILSLLFVVASAAGLMVYPSKNSVIQSNATAIFVGALLVFYLKTSLFYAQAPYIIVLGAITVIVALILINVAIMVKGKK